MGRRATVAVVFLAVCTLGSQALSACGDKFVLLGRGVRFQRAYAAIHPAAILLVVPPKSVKVAAVRDPRLKSALTMAGHRVEVVQAAGFAAALLASRYDIVLAEGADATGVREAPAAAGRKPAVICVLESPSAGDLVAAQQRFDGVLKTPQALPDILRLLDDVMKARLERARAGTF
jgi:hypothetical protein